MEGTVTAMRGRLFRILRAALPTAGLFACLAGCLTPEKAEKEADETAVGLATAYWREQTGSTNEFNVSRPLDVLTLRIALEAVRQGVTNAIFPRIDGVAPLEGVTDANGSIRDALAKIRKPGMALVVSDCYDPNGLDASLERLLARRFDPVVLQIYDESESNPQDRGDYVFEDAESGATRTFTVDENTLKRYRAAFQNFIAMVRTSCVKRGVRFYSTSIGVPFETFLLNVTCDMTNRAVK